MCSWLFSPSSSMLAAAPTTTLELLAEAAAAATPSPTLAMLHVLSSTPGEIPKLVCVQRGGRANSARRREDTVNGRGVLKLVNNDFVAPPGLCDSAGQRLQPSSNWKVWLEADDIHVLLDDETLLVMQISRHCGAEQLRWRLPTRSCQRALFEDGCFFLRLYVEGRSARKSSIEVQLRHNDVVIADGIFTVFMGTKQMSTAQSTLVLPLRSKPILEMSASTVHRRQKQRFPGRRPRSPDAASALPTALPTASPTASLTEPKFRRATFTTRTAAVKEAWGMLPAFDDPPFQPIVLPGITDYTLLDLSIDATLGRPEQLSEEEQQLVAELNLRM